MDSNEKMPPANDSNPPPYAFQNGEKSLLPDYTEATTLTPTSFASLSLHMNDSLRLLHFPSPITDLLRTTITTAWPRGIQSERLYGGAHEFKLYGNPWLGFRDDDVHARRLICALLAALHTQGWILELSTFVSTKNTDKDNLLFRRKSPTPAECEWGCVSFSNADRLRFIDLPPQVSNGVVARLDSSAVQDHQLHSPGVYEIKLAGWPWHAAGERTMLVRELCLHLLEALESEGWTVYASVAQKTGGRDKEAVTDTWHCCRVKDGSSDVPVIVTDLMD